jgi:hypothetical protein
MAPKPLLAGLKVAALGLPLVGENERFTSWLTFESLAELVEAEGGKFQTGPNSATDIVVTGSFAREGPDFKDGAKYLALQAERDMGADRKRRLTVLTLEEFLATYGLTDAAIENAVTARLDPGKKYLPPGPAKRKRASIFSYVLVHSGDGQSGAAKGLASGTYEKEELFPEE